MNGEIKLTCPTIHLNGTSADALLKALGEAHVSLSSALEKLARAAPNARDYYVQFQGDEAMNAARREHQSRRDRIVDVMNELVFIMDNIDEQVTARKPR